MLNEGASIVDVSSNDDYPYLSCALGKKEDNFNPADPTIQKIMRGLLAELIDCHRPWYIGGNISR